MTRFAQLTYSSFDRRDGNGGGWQVKDVTGGLSAEEQRLLCGHVATQLDAGVELPRFPTPAEIAELPHQMMHMPVRLDDAEALVTWHLAPAGVDASGRPGNVFAHVLVDHDFDPTDGLRPIERWRSPDWLIPYGPEAVLGADLTGEVPGRGHVDRRTVASWLFAPRQWRTNTLAAILDALAGHRAGGLPVVLATEDVDEAANWIAAVSLCTSAGAAAHISFSTLERASGLRHAIGHGIEIICVPRLDVPELAHNDKVVVIDTAAHVEVADLGGEHRTDRGDAIPATPWSAMILELCADPATFVEAVTEMDAAAVSVGDRGLHPAWPAALLIARDPDSDLAHEATTIIARYSPDELRNSELYDVVADGLAADAGSTAEAWHHVVLQGAHDDEPERNLVLAEAAVATYVGLALEDEQWLARPGPGKLPARHLKPDAVNGEWVASAITRMHASDPVVLIHAIELALRMGLERDGTLRQLMIEQVRKQLVPRLIDLEGGHELALQLEELGAETRHLLWGEIARHPQMQWGRRPPGALLASPVVDLLGPAADEPDPLMNVDPSRNTGRRPPSVAPMLTELAFAAVRQADAPEHARFIAAWAQIEAGGVDDQGRRLTPDTVSSLVIPPFDACRTRSMVQRFGPQVPRAWHLPHLLGTGDTSDWREVWMLLQRGPDAMLGYLAALRLEQGKPLGPPPLVVGQARAVAAAAALHPVQDPAARHRAHLVLAATLLHGTLVAVPDALDQPDRMSADEVKMLSEWGPQALSVPKLVEVFARRAQGSPLYEEAPDSGTTARALTWLFGLGATTRTETVPLVVALLQEKAAHGGSDEIIAAVSSVPGLGERDIKSLERWLNHWLRRERRREGW